jgi:putative endonuclease
LISVIEKHLKEHDAGITGSTKAYRPWRLFFSNLYSLSSSSKNREKYYKSGVGKERLKEKLADIVE